MLELPEGLAQQDLLVDGDVLAADADGLEPEFGLAVRRGRVGEHFEAGGDDRAHRRIAPRVCGVVEPSGAHTGELARTCEKRTLHFIGVVKHRTSYLPS
jgi:hypothetical protein